MKIEQNKVDDLNIELTLSIASDDYSEKRKKRLNEHKRTAELKGFRKVELDAGESCTVEFPVDADLLGFYNHDLEKVVEPGEFRIFIGGSSTVSDYAVLTVK